MCGHLTKLFSPIFFLFSNDLDAENLKAKNIEHFYNSVYLLGEFYNRLHQKAHPILIMGKSLFELLTKQLRKEFARCTSDGDYAFDVRFARLLLAQVRHRDVNRVPQSYGMTHLRFIAGDIEW